MVSDLHLIVSTLTRLIILMKKFYFIVQKEDANCPLGYYDIILLDKNQPEADKNFSILLPWYAMEALNSPAPLSNALWIKAKRKYDYPVRTDSGKFIVMQKDFFDIVKNYKNNFAQVEQCDYISRGKLVSKDYFVATTHKLSLESALNLSMCLQDEIYQKVIDFKKIKISEYVDYDLFNINWDTTQFTLIISEKLKLELEHKKMKGIQFLDVDSTDLLTRRETATLDINQLPRYAPI